VRHLPKDESTIINDEVLDYSRTAIERYVRHCDWKIQTYSELFALVMAKAKKSTSSEEVAFFKERLIWFARAEADILALVDLMKAESTGIEHFEIGEDYKWRILKVYSSFSEDAQALVDAESGESDTASYGRIYCYYAYPNNKAEKFMEILEKGPKYSNYEQEFSMGGFGATINKDLLLPCTDLFFEKFLDVLENTNKEFALKYTEEMVPDYADEDEMINKILQLIRRIQENSEGYPAVVKSLNESIDSFTRTSRGKKLSQKVIDSLN